MMNCLTIPLGEQNNFNDVYADAMMTTQLS